MEDGETTGKSVPKRASYIPTKIEMTQRRYKSRRGMRNAGVAEREEEGERKRNKKNPFYIDAGMLQRHCLIGTFSFPIHLIIHKLSPHTFIGYESSHTPTFIQFT